jgi:hypothetical protein
MKLSWTTVGLNPCNCLEWLTKATKDLNKITSVLPEAPTQDLTETNINSFSYANLLNDDVCNPNYIISNGGVSNE